MAKKRLNQSDRRALTRFASRNIKTEKETRAKEAAYQKACKAVIQDVQKCFPPEEMKILLKYKVASRDDCIKGATPSGQFLGFEFNENDGPLTPNKYCSSRSIPFRQSTAEAIEKFDLAKTTEKDAHRKIMSDYQALINGSRYFEDVVEIWPAADALSESICSQSTALTAIDESAKRRISEMNVGAEVAA